MTTFCVDVCSMLLAKRLFLSVQVGGLLLAYFSVNELVSCDYI